MDVHRSRFVSHPVRPITAVAFSRFSDEKLPTGFAQPTLRLAIGRDNGHIEIWNPLGGKWVQETVFVGGSSKSIDGLVWTREPDETNFDGQPVLGQHRLFSIASSPDVTEWDLQKGTPKKKSTGNFSEAWCFAAQPRQQPGGKEEQKSQDLVAGCGDGSIVLLSTTDNDLQFQRFLARVSGKKAKCMSITYQKRDRVVAGFADSNIRVIDTRNGSILRTMSLGAGLPPAPKTKFVWKVKCLPNGDIVSGDSNGDVVFWDGRSYSLTQRIKGHDSDCIDIVTSEDGKTIFTGSLDGRLAVYHHITNPAGRRSWAKAHHRRTHTKSEVKAMSAYDSNDLSVVVSGGGDLAPVITPLREYGKENLRPLPHLPQLPPVTSARQARLLVSWAENHISVWKISRSQNLEFSTEPEAPRKLVAKITLNTKQTIRSAAVSDDGKLLVAATDSELKAFQLRKRPESEALIPRKVDVPESLASDGARVVRFSPDSKWLAVVKLDNEVHVARTAAVPEKPKHMQILGRTVELERSDKQLNSVDAFRAYDQTITRLAFSSDSCVLAASDLSGHLDTWVLEGHEDPTAPAIDVTQDDSKKGGSNADDSSESSDDEEDELVVYYGQHWAENPASHLLPKLDSAPLVLSFRPTPKPAQSHNLVNGNPGVHSTRHNPHAHSHELPKGPYKLWIMTAKHQMYEFDILAGRLTDWSRNNPTSLLPEDFNRARDRVIGAVWDVSSERDRIWLYGSNWLFMLNVSLNLPSKKRRQSHGGAEMQTPKKLKTSGAGSRTIASERDGLPGKLLRIESGDEMEVDLDSSSSSRQPKPDDEALDQDDLNEDVELRLTRVKSTDDDDAATDSQVPKERQWWCTFKYRPILGVVPLGDSASTAEDDRPLEVVVVERPVWDILEGAKNGS
ncbi:Putative quinoprotein alcohol dehydrogenase-like superfamily [Septoria linicola]|uniref:Quinoprotein alcohol dehydrogenase-like superfamily n=1 Tax=Septoria linicola TaxID=215465 RepID=A0A9Q9AKS4_9PEZI|nr:putative quinoprotein alcohol dehydrogenase-like superfamily [Septoria linicola]USW48773.1 Putative quinoprotein alcohol dehydrogenase-like superfamily [Septoria linicola]